MPQSLFHILGTARDEMTHSAFIAWLLAGEEFPRKAEAMHLFLNLLKTVVKDDANKIDSHLCQMFSLPDLEIDILDVSTEKVVSQLSCIESNDRIDIFISLLLKGGNERKRVDVVIENKIDSEQGGRKDGRKCNDETYNDKLQTERYYYALKEPPFIGRADVDATLFVYLEASYQMPFLSQGDNKPHPSFIRINYQMLLDEVIEKVVINATPELKCILDDYIRCLSQYARSKKCAIMAVRACEREQLVKNWKLYCLNGDDDIYKCNLSLAELYTTAVAAAQKKDKNAVEWLKEFHGKHNDKVDVYDVKNNCWSKNMSHKETALYIITQELDNDSQGTFFMLQNISGKGGLISLTQKSHYRDCVGEIDGKKLYLIDAWDVFSNGKEGNFLQLLTAVRDKYRVRKASE